MTELESNQSAPTPGYGPMPLLGSSVSSTPQNNIDSATFLQEMAFTGIQIRVPLPFGAENGFQPMFAIRVGPNLNPPVILLDSTMQSNLLAGTGTDLRPMINGTLDLMPMRLFNECTAKWTGPEPPQSIFSKHYRYNRCDIVYNMRIVSTYTGGGILMVVPIKGVPRGSAPLTTGTGVNMIGNAAMINSNIQADLSKSRQVRFVYPYEYPTEFQDVQEDLYVPKYKPGVNMRNMMQFDNWFVVGMRDSIITPTNATFIDIFIDYAFGKYQLHTPLLPLPTSVMPAFTSFQHNDVTSVFSIVQSDFADINGTDLNHLELFNETGSAIAIQSPDGDTITVAAGGTHFVSFGDRIWVKLSSDDNDTTTWSSTTSTSGIRYGQSTSLLVIYTDTSGSDIEVSGLISKENLIEITSALTVKLAS